MVDGGGETGGGHAGMDSRSGWYGLSVGADRGGGLWYIIID